MENMMILYKSLIASYLNYGLLLWGTESYKVLTLQKKAIRLISNSSYISHTNLLFIQHKLLKIGDLFKLKLLKLYYKLSYNHLPSYFDKYREIIEHEPASVLRINYIYPPLIRRVYVKCSPLLQLIKLINDLKNDESDTILQQKTCETIHIEPFLIMYPGCIWIHMIPYVQLVYKHVMFVN